MADVVDHITDSLPKEEERRETDYICRNGLHVRIKKINGRIMVDAVKKLPVPKVPKVWMEEKGREEENPNHPDYQEAIASYTFAQEEIAFNVTFALGVDVIDIPDSLEPIESTEWSDRLKEAWEMSGIDIDIPAEGNRRKVLWLKYYAIPDEDEQTEILTRVLEMGGGVIAEKVEEAMASFRSPEERLADNGIQVIE